MGEALKKLNNLEVLNLGDCLLKTAGAKLICRALKGRHPKLRELILDSNEIRVNGGLEIAEMVKDKNNLEKCSIAGNQFGESGPEKILKKFADVGKSDILEEIEDNEDPDSDEEDPDISDEEDSVPADESTPVKDAKSPNALFSGTPSASSVFGEKPSAAVNLFGSSSNSSFKPAGNIFTKDSSASNIFSPSTQSSPFVKSTESPFSKPAADSTSSPFGSAKTSEAPSGSIFGGSSGAPAFGSSSTSVFGQSSATSVFGKPASTSSVFGAPTDAPSSSVFGGASGVFGKPPTSVDKPDSTSNIFGSSSTSNSTFSFGALAANTESSGFKSAGEGFKFAGAGSSLFGSSKPKDNKEDDNEDDEEEDNNHDPHFEPIVPLPELVDVKTGEEDEEVVFKHRAKVYRYCGDTKQWKERGVGDLKILKDPRSGVYRVLLRRDQVHKIAANHRITSEMVLKPLASSETAWCWYAMDFSEGHEAEGSLEQLAVRFKTAETAKEFKDQFESCQKSLDSGETRTVKESSQEQTVTTDEAAGAEDAGEYEDYDDDYDEGGETTMFHQMATLEIKSEGSDKWVSQGEVDL